MTTIKTLIIDHHFNFIQFTNKIKIRNNKDQIDS